MESKIQMSLTATNIKKILLVVKVINFLNFVYNFISSMIEQSKYFNKELVMTKKDNEHFENSTKMLDL